jgi:hypothetical protein
MPADDLSKIPPFFILGRPRSGTTLLTTLFNAHPNIRIAPEFPVMMFLYRKFKNVKVWDEDTIRSFVDHAFYHSKNSKINERRVNNLRIDKEFIIGELLRYKEVGSIQLFLKSIDYYAFSLYDKGETKWIGDKNPVYSIFANRIQRIFPDAKFICIIRDYRDNFISMRKLADREVAVEAPSIPLQVARWKYFTKLFLDCKRRFPDRYYILRYEDLVTDQEKTFRSLCDFLGIVYTPAVFEYHKRKEETKQTYGTSGVWERFHENLLKPINTGSMNTWQDKLTVKEVKLADQIAGKYADKLGYERRYKGFYLWMLIKSAPLLAYNYVLLTLMIFGTYLPFKMSQWWYLKSLILLKTYLKLTGKKSMIKIQ